MSVLKNPFQLKTKSHKNKVLLILESCSSIIFFLCSV